MIALYRDGLTLFIRGIVHDALDAEELMIDTFARFAVKGRQFEGRSSMKTYLYSIGRNLALRHLKKHKNERCLITDEVHAVQENPEAELLRKEDQRQLYYALGQLKAEYRDTLYLLYFEDMSYREAGKVLQKTEKQIGDLAYRGKIALKVILEKEREPT